MNALDLEFDMNQEEIEAFHQGNGTLSYKSLGAHKEEDGFRFTVWAPNAQDVYVIGDFNGWEIGADSMHAVSGSGVYTAFIPRVFQKAFLFLT